MLSGHKEFFIYSFQPIEIIQKYAEDGEYKIFAHFIFNGHHLWVIGLIDISNINMRIGVSFERNADTIRIITKYIEPGNILKFDSWPTCDWLDDINRYRISAYKA